MISDLAEYHNVFHSHLPDSQWIWIVLYFISVIFHHVLSICRSDYFDCIECFTTTFLRAHSWLNWVVQIWLQIANWSAQWLNSLQGVQTPVLSSSKYMIINIYKSLSWMTANIELIFALNVFMLVIVCTLAFYIIIIFISRLLLYYINAFMNLYWNAHTNSYLGDDRPHIFYAVKIRRTGLSTGSSAYVSRYDTYDTLYGRALCRPWQYIFYNHRIWFQ